MSFFHRFLTEFEQEMLKEMDNPEKWIANDYTIEHVAGFRYWVTNMPLIDFGSVKPISKVPTPKFSGFIAKFLLWKKYYFTLKPVLDKQNYDEAKKKLEDEQGYVLKNIGEQQKMKREILFRGKSIEIGEWIEGGICIGDNCAHIVRQITQHIKRDDYECYAVEVYPVTVSQFTGLIDKNGKKIFENDVLRVVTSFNTEMFVTHVEFKNAQFRLANNRNMFYFGQKNLNCMDDAEIIGNIFDNPELVAKHD